MRVIETGRGNATVIPPILVDKYMQLIGKDTKGGYFLTLPPNVR